MIRKELEEKTLLLPMQKMLEKIKMKSISQEEKI